MAEEIIRGILPAEIPTIVDEIDIKYEETEFSDHPMDTVEQLNTCEIKSESDQETETKRTHARRRNGKNCKDPIRTETHSNYICGNCDQSFDAHFKLIHHVQTYLKFCESCKLCFVNNRVLFQHKKTHRIKQPSRKNTSRKRVQESKALQNNGQPSSSSTKTCTESSAPEESQHHNANIDKVICTSQNQHTATVIGEINQTSKTGSELLVHSMTHTAGTLQKTERSKIRQNKISTGLSTRNIHTRSCKENVGKSKLIAQGVDESTHQVDKNFSGGASDLTSDSNDELILHKKSHTGRKHTKKDKSRGTDDLSFSEFPQNNGLSSSTKTYTKSSAPEENQHHNCNIDKVICTSQNEDTATVTGEANQTGIKVSEVLVHSMTHTANTLPKTEKLKIRQNKISTELPTHHMHTRSGKYDVGKSKLIPQGGDESAHQKGKEFSCKVCDLTLHSNDELILHKKTKKSHTGRKHQNKINSRRTVDFSKDDLKTQTRDKSFSSETCKETSYTEKSLSPHVNAQDARNSSRTCDDASKTAITESELTVNELSHSNPTLPKMEKRIEIRLDRISTGDIMILTKKPTADTTRYTRNTSDQDDHDKSKLIPQDRDDTGEKTCSSKTRIETSDIKYKLRRRKDTHNGESYSNHKKNSVTCHSKIYSGEKPYASQIHGRKLRSKSVSQTHLKILKGGRKCLRNHSVGKQHKCDVCGKQFAAKCHFIVHMRRHTGEKPFKCDKCPKSFVTNYALKTHESVHTVVKPFKCDVCGKEFTVKYNCVVHMRRHTGEKPFKCNKCPNSFVTKYDLKYHEQSIHSVDKAFKCGICQKGFPDKRHMKRHELIHTGVKSFKCDVCHKSFGMKFYLKLHRRIHTGEKPYMCDVCGMSFARCNTLNMHKRRHSGQKPYNCGDCEKSFATLGELTVHKRIHTGVKPFRCGECDKNFSSSQNLTVHKRTHTGEKPFDCDVCHKCFAAKSYLYIHKTLHTGGRPFKCNVCNTGCTTKTTLNIHLRTHTGEKPFKCNECDKCFSEKGSLNAHRRRKHTLKKLP